MNPVLYKLADVLLTAVSVGLTREDVLGKVSELEAQGATPEAITEAIKKMRDEAIEATQKRIDAA